VIGVCKSIVKIEKYDNTFSAAAIGGITCSVLIIVCPEAITHDTTEFDHGAVSCLYFVL